MLLMQPLTLRKRLMSSVWISRWWNVSWVRPSTKKTGMRSRRPLRTLNWTLQQSLLRNSLRMGWLKRLLRSRKSRIEQRKSSCSQRNLKSWRKRWRTLSWPLSRTKVRHSSSRLTMRSTLSLMIRWSRLRPCLDLQTVCLNCVQTQEIGKINWH